MNNSISRRGESLKFHRGFCCVLLVFFGKTFTFTVPSRRTRSASEELFAVARRMIKSPGSSIYEDHKMQPNEAMS